MGQRDTETDETEITACIIVIVSILQRIRMLACAAEVVLTSLVNSGGGAYIENTSPRFSVCTWWGNTAQLTADTAMPVAV